MPITSVPIVESGPDVDGSASARTIEAEPTQHRYPESGGEICGDCATYSESTTPTTGGYEVCQGCLASYSVCNRCERHARTTHATIDDGNVCSGCATDYYWRCYDCGRYAQYANRNDFGQDVCGDCTELDYTWCQDCYDVLVSSGDYCSRCNESHDTSDLIEDYSFKPYPQFHGDGPLFVGLELEVSVPEGRLSDAAYTADEHLGALAYLKEDSSISGQGFEIVTHPMSYEWAMERFPWDLLDALRTMGAEADGNGLHLHVSRAAFDGPSHIFRWMKFFYRNQPEVIAMARRTCDQWAAFSSRTRENIKHYAKGDKGPRYQAINTQNDDTLELRIFAGTLNRQQAKAAIGLAVASVEYTRTLTTADITRRHGWRWSTFADWVATRSQFAPLLAEMENLPCAC